MRQTLMLALAAVIIVGLPVVAQTPAQPKVQPGPVEPDWIAILEARYGLKMFADLVNPVKTTPYATPGLFKKAGPGPVTYTPLIALGTEMVTRGGWYTTRDVAFSGPFVLRRPIKHDLWSYKFKNSARDIEQDTNMPPPLASGSTTTFDPGGDPFGLWITNGSFDDGGVFTEPALVTANARLAKQPYKAMIYPFKDKATGKFVPHSYLIGWEYSTNDDFQDVVCRVDNVDFITSAR